ncbi:competence protein TfoX [Neisseria animaloris]|uniref:TfoX N-terminal domain n=1 Tax=Neisseria animaloris TaxID=326522 RepID=A0A448UC10_9NEIS|nr:competence protein TfoX [Neisseria animaloris]VEJ21422.1 TfoX N-terminal domain [Neisseria animaloris]
MTARLLLKLFGYTWEKRGAYGIRQSIFGFYSGTIIRLERHHISSHDGEYILYYKQKIVGGIYDDRLPVKPVQPAIDYMPNVAYELPYEGAKAMLLVSEVDDKAFLTGLFEAMYDELPQAKPKKK